MTNNDQHLLRLVGVRKEYKGRTVLSIGSFLLARGDKISLEGPNGSGKSTFLRLLAGVSTPTNGLIERTDDFNLLRIGFVPQGGGLYDDMTLRENLSIFTRIHGVRIPIEKLEFVEKVGLTPFLDVPVGILSGGFQQLAALACALAGNPNALLLDEPTTDLDRQHAQQIQDTVAALSPTLTFIVISTHDAPKFPFLNRSVTISNGSVT